MKLTPDLLPDARHPLPIQVQSKTIMAVVNSYPVYRLFDFFMLTGTLGLGVCYAIARYLGHVGTFCDISSLVVQLPERIIFRMNFSLVGSLLAAMAFPIHNMLQKRVGGWAPTFAAIFQCLSGLGVILVGACGPSEIIEVHLLAAFLGFGGSAFAQIIYNFVFFSEDKQTQPDSAKRIFAVRSLLSVVFLICATCLGLCEAGILPEEPFGHIFEWSLWFNLLFWYFTFKYDLKDFYVGSLDDDAEAKSSTVVHMGVPLLSL